MYNSNIDVLQETILEQFQDIDEQRMYENRLSGKSIKMLIDLLEAFEIEAKCSQNRSLIEESESYDNILRKLILEYKFRRKMILEGFENPFVEYSGNLIGTSDNISYEYKPKADVKIKGVAIWCDNSPNKIMYKNGKMISGKSFYKGDVIEECPIRLISDQDLYSKNVRDFAFPIDRVNRKYAIPFGYASYYRNSKDTGIEPNITYSYVDGEEPYIKIVAIGKIGKNDELILFADDDDFENELNPDQFSYPSHKDVFTSVKNFKFV